MSIEKAFDPVSEEILKASDIPDYAGGEKPEDFPETVIMCFSEKMMKIAVKLPGTEEITALLEGQRVPVYRVRTGTDRKGNMKYAALVRSGVGAPMAAIVAEELIAKGAKNFIVFGSCGLLDGGLSEGHVIVPERAWRDEGTSYHYMPASDWIEIKNAYYLAGLFKGMGVSYVMGGLWTTDALFRETKDNVEARRQAGCIAVDMECAALQAVCDFRGCELYQFVYAEDSLEEEEWDPRNMILVSEEQMNFHLNLALEIARHLYPM